jgi:phage anti-repressor protein
MTTFTMALAQNIYSSNEQFPINFDDAWQWLGYSKKSNAKRTLVQNFERDFDFLINEQATTTGISAIPTELIYISIDCFKQLAMMAKTDVGKVARKYFIECEKIAKASMADKLVPSNPNQGLLNEVYNAAKLGCYKTGYHANAAMTYTINTIHELKPAFNDTLVEGLFRAGLRLTLQPKHTMIGEECGNTIVKQLRQTQIHREGVETVADHLLTKKELKDKQRALENNPSTKENLLPIREEVERKDLTPANLDNIIHPALHGDNEQPKLAPGVPEGFVIDIPLDNIH